MIYEISEIGLNLIKHYEGLHDGDLTQIGLQPKMCPAGIWTVGYGHALWYDGRWLKGEDDKELAYSLYPNLTEEQAEVLLRNDTIIFASRLATLNLPLTAQEQIDALVSFTFNIGTKAFTGSTLYRYINGKITTPENICWAFSKWNKARVDGILKPLPGLTARRKSECILYNTGKLNF